MRPRQPLLGAAEVRRLPSVAPAVPLVLQAAVVGTGQDCYSHCRLPQSPPPAGASHPQQLMMTIQTTQQARAQRLRLCLLAPH